jgi:hypothetical protein
VGGLDDDVESVEEKNEAAPTLVRSRTPAQFEVEIDDEDPDRSVELSELLKENYDRKTIDQICEDELLRVTLESSDAPEMQVWVNTGERWDDIDSGVAFPQKWSEKNKKFPQSVCRMLIKDFFGLSEMQYKLIRHEFNRKKSGDLVGIYKAKDGKNVPAIVLAVRVPKSAWDAHGKVAGAALLTGALGTFLTGATVKTLANRGPKNLRDLKQEKAALEDDIEKATWALDNDAEYQGTGNDKRTALEETKVKNEKRVAVIDHLIASLKDDQESKRSIFKEAQQEAANAQAEEQKNQERESRLQTFGRKYLGLPVGAASGGVFAAAPDALF